MKRLKKHSITIFYLTCALIISVGCAKDKVSNDSTTRVPISLRSGNGAVSLDKQIKTIRLIFFSSTGELVSNWLYNIPTGENPGVVTGKMTIGMNNIYVICNETPELGRDLANITRPGQIAAIRFTPPVGGITDPVPMFCHLPDVKIERGNGSAVDVTIGSVTKPYLEATVTRIAAKIGMTVIKNVPTGEADFSIEKLSYKICRVPAYSMLSEQETRYPQGEGWGTDIKVEGQGRIAVSSNGDYAVTGDLVSTDPTNLDAIHCPAVYIPEHKPQSPENPDYCTYLLIETNCMTEYSSTPIRSVYRINMGKLPPTDLSIERNVNYQVYLKITGLGATGFYAEIVPVDEYDLPLTWKPSEGYAIMGERIEDYGVQTNIWNSYSQYSGILKVVNGKTYKDACFRYGSVVALSSTTTAGAFNPVTDILWMPEATKNNTNITSWDNVGYMMTSEDVSGTTHTLENIKKGKGDPCRLVGLSESEILADNIDNGLWRLPTKSEMQWLIEAQNNTKDVRGHYSFSTLLTPYYGYRSETGDMMPSSVATNGYYWSATGANALSFSATNAAVIAPDDPRRAYSVRCIRTDIPESTFSVNAFELGYLGGTKEIVTSANNIITPFWRMTVTDPTSASQITLAKSEGSSKETNPVTVKPLPDPYKTAEYVVNVTGYGLDGLIHQKTANIIQRALRHNVEVSWTSVPPLTESEGYYRIPVDGAEISFTTNITPEPFAPYDLGFDDKLWCIRCRYYTDILNEVYGTEVKRGGTSVIKIPENIRNHILGLEFDIIPVVKESYPPYASDVMLLIQNKK